MSTSLRNSFGLSGTAGIGLTLAHQTLDQPANEPDQDSKSDKNRENKSNEEHGKGDQGISQILQALDKGTHRLLQRLTRLPDACRSFYTCFFRHRDRQCRITCTILKSTHLAFHLFDTSAYVGESRGDIERILDCARTLQDFHVLRFFRLGCLKTRFKI